MLKTLKTWIVNIFTAIQKGQQLRAEYIILSNLTDRELKDIGLTRGELKHRITTQ
jgi:uncharacterized protein YjiS (DUF1127 family)